MFNEDTRYFPQRSISTTFKTISERVIKIYERLSKGIGLIPRTLAFVFDRENRTETQISDLERRLRGNRVRCLKRTMIENYFLNAEAILSVLVQCGVPADNHVSIEQISAWLNKRLEGKDLESPQVKRYFNKVPLNKRGIDTVHGGHLLEDLFSNFSGKTVPYDKPRHGLKLTEWLIEHNPQALGEVKDLLAQIFPNE